ncbi:protein phosphatase 2C domain-containing protein [Streptomyces sp. NPDC051684]|uniref:protein phosphatase 2C domain-containing protein n=1 Tax=Streptomyces sp. NPDC051684 TaxID=3365670 RepID=UPI00379C9150
MSQQGERHTGHPAQGDDWWGKLYDNETAAEDTGPTPSPDTLDDRFSSAGAVAAPRGPGDPDAASGRPRSGDSDAASGRPRSGDSDAASGRPRSGDLDGTSEPSEGRHAVYPETHHVWDAPGPPSGAALPPEPPHPPAGDAPGPAEPSAPRPPAVGDAPDASQPGAPPPPAAARPAGDAPRREAPPANAVPPPPGPPPIDFGVPPAEARHREAAPPPPRTPPPPREAPRAEPVPPAPEAPPAPPEAPSTGPVPLPPEAPYAEAPPTPPGAPHADAAPSPPESALSGAGPAPSQAPPVVYVGDGPPTYEAEPTALPLADPEDLGELVADTVLDGARCGVSTLRAASVRGDSARYRGEPRRDSLLTARFGSGATALILVAMATGARATPGAHRAAAEVCDWIGRAVGLSHARLAEDIRAGRRGDLKSGLHRLTDRSLGKVRAGATEQGLDPEEYAATLRCLLLPADPACRTRVFFGVGGGGLFRLRDGEWRDIEPSVAEQSGAPVVGFGSSPPAETPDGDRLTMDLSITTPPSPYEPAPPPPRDAFRFRASVARPGDTLLLCSPGLAEPLRGEPDLARHLANRWAETDPPGLAAFLADTQVRVKGYADDRTAAAVWEA